MKAVRWEGGGMMRGWMILGLWLLVTQIGAQTAGPSQVEIDRMREQLQMREREREAAHEARQLVTWTQTATAPKAAGVSQMASVRLASEMNILRALWIFEPEDNQGRIVRIPLAVRGEQWIALAPGRWRARLIAGTGDGEPVRLPVWSVTARRGEAYELVLTRSTEKALRGMMREDQRRREEKAKETKKPSEKPQRKPNRPGTAKLPSATVIIPSNR